METMPSHSRSSIRRRLSRVCTLVALLGICWLAFQAYQRYERHRQQTEWMRRVEERGAKAVLCGYGGVGPFARIPFVGELSGKRQVEVFLPSSRVAGSVLELLTEYPELGRIWIHKHNVNSRTVERIKKARSDVQIQFYTPSPVFAQQFKPEN